MSLRYGGKPLESSEKVRCGNALGVEKAKECPFGWLAIEKAKACLRRLRESLGMLLGDREAKECPRNALRDKPLL